MTRRYSTHLLAQALVATSMCLLPASPSPGETESSWKMTALTSVAGMTDLDAPRDPDDPGIGGGIDSANFFRTRLLPKLADCTDQVEEPILSWIKVHQLTVPKSERGPGSLLIHATNDTLRGLFEFTYRVDGKRERARATLYFYSTDGERHEPLGIKQMLESYEIEALQDDLDAALQCGSI